MCPRWTGITIGFTAGLPFKVGENLVEGRLGGGLKDFQYHFGEVVRYVVPFRCRALTEHFVRGLDQADSIVNVFTRKFSDLDGSNLLDDE